MYNATLLPAPTRKCDRELRRLRVPIVGVSIPARGHASYLTIWGLQNLENSRLPVSVCTIFYMVFPAALLPAGEGRAEASR